MLDPWIESVEFHSSHHDFKKIPQNKTMPQVAFCGRSNAGKSSLINAILGKKDLVHTSSTPGKTRSLNFFLLNRRIFLVDLPGFGYARVAKSLKAEWNRNLTAYLEQRPCLQIFVHLIDSRHPDLEIDKNVNEFLKAIKRGDQIRIQAFTKTDKLTQSELGKLKRDFPDGIFISNLKKKGMLDLQNRITGYLFGN